NSFVTVSIATNAGAGTLSGTLTVQASGGIATFSGLSINKAGAGYTLGAVDGSLGVATSSSFTISPANAHHLAFLQQPTNTAPTQAIASPVTVQVLDPFNNRVSSDLTTVTIAIGANPGFGGTLSGSTSATVSGGTATFSNLSINKSGAGYTL